MVVVTRHACRQFRKRYRRAWTKEFRRYFIDLAHRKFHDGVVVKQDPERQSKTYLVSRHGSLYAPVYVQPDLTQEQYVLVTFVSPAHMRAEIEALPSHLRRDVLLLS